MENPSLNELCLTTTSEILAISEGRFKQFYEFLSKVSEDLNHQVKNNNKINRDDKEFVKNIITKIDYLRIIIKDIKLSALSLFSYQHHFDILEQDLTFDEKTTEINPVCMLRLFTSDFYLDELIKRFSNPVVKKPSSFISKLMEKMLSM